MTQTQVGNYRWSIVALLFFATTINYMDRQVIGYLKPLFSKPPSEGGFGWTGTDFGNITTAFTFFYAGFTLLAGWIIDRIGTKLGLALSLMIWSVFGMLNAFCGSSVFNHAAVRSFFGLGEAGNFPASIKTVAEWFPKKERALATGIFNSGSNVGAMIAALVVPLIAYSVWFNGSIAGWQMAYLLTGAVGLIWLIFWFALYNPPSRLKKLSPAEYNYIHSDSTNATTGKITEEDKAKIPWFKLLRFAPTWSFVTGKFLTDGVWWFLLFWLPDYMSQQFHMEGHQIMLPLFTVYGVGILGSIFGGGFPMFFINRGMPVQRARMTAMLIIALFPILLIFTQYFGNVERFGDHAYIYALTVICIAAAAHQAWSANLFTTVSDMFPKKAVGSVTGIGGLMGGVGGAAVQQLQGRLSDHYKALGHITTAYNILFAVCGFVYVIAWIIMYFLLKNRRMVTL